MKNVLIVSHADGDGHVIAEQVRRTLSSVPTFSVSTVVDPARTPGHKVWLNLSRLSEIDACEIVLFVDLMFAPDSFQDEAGALVDFVLDRPAKQFFVLDHHPLPLGHLCRAPNLRSVYQRDVVDCTFGRPSWLMDIAALLERSKQPTRVRCRSRDHRFLVKGIQRAAAIGGPLPGDKLLALMRFNYWHELAELGREAPHLHRLPRGRRSASAPLSDLMNRLDRLATDLLESRSGSMEASHPEGSAFMSYDLDLLPGGMPPTPEITPSDPRDLAAIMTLLELAAICLTDTPESSFTREELLAKACELGGGELDLDASDLKIVLGKAGLLAKVPGKPRYRLK